MKKDMIYFENYATCAAMSVDMAKAVNAFLEKFDPKGLDQQMKLIHGMEHAADEKKHELFSALVRAFVTPIDRDELINISQSIDDVMDAMDDIIIEMNITQVKSVKPESLAFGKLIIRCCTAMAQLMEEFKDFKRSKKIKDLIIEINCLEEEGDRLYISAMKNLYAVCPDPLEVMSWREIYSAFETVCDKCEDVADIVESIIIGNL
jgi:predicted phosphate transport protein (TIGR00153 family)